MKTKREETKRKIIMNLLDGQERMQEEIASKVGEREDYISPIIKELEQDGIIRREVRKSPKTYEDRKKGGEVTKDYLVKFCRLDTSLKTFRLLVKDFYKSKNDKFEEDDICKFMRSEYFQSVVDENFVDHFAAEWFKEYARFFKIQFPKRGKSIEELRDEFFTKLDLKKDDFIQILQVSPASLYIFLFPEETIPSLELGASVKACFSFSFAMDMLTYGTPEGKGINVKFEVGYGDVRKGKKGLKVVPSLKIEAPFGIIHLKRMEVEKHANNP